MSLVDAMMAVRALEPQSVEMPQTSLLWIDCNEQQPAKRYEATVAARQHVMLNYIARKRPDHKTDSERLSRRSASEDTDGAEGRGQGQPDESDFLSKPDEWTRSSASRRSAALKARRRRSRVDGGIALTKGTKLPLVSTLRPALVRPQDNEIYKAAWWHSLNVSDAKDGWIKDCRSEWGAGFWYLAQEDDTLREVFLSYAAAKEAAVKSLCNSKDYFIHKGKAMRLISEDLHKEGKSLRTGALAGICLLSKAAFIEEDYVAGEAHVAALDAVINDRLMSLSSFVWLVVVWADLRLTGVSTRAPVFSCTPHSHFDGAQLPKKATERARVLCECSALTLPEPTILTFERFSLLLLYLFELVECYNNANEMDWQISWVITHSTCHMLASMKNEVFSQEPGKGTPYSPEKALLLGCNIQYWTTVAQFVPQAGVLRFALDQLTQELSHVEPEILCGHWIANSGQLSSLLWMLFNTSAAAIKLCFHGSLSTNRLPHWLWLDLKHVTGALSISTPALLQESLEQFPFAHNWNLDMIKMVWLWLKTGFVLPDGVDREKRKRKTFFANFRLTFDTEVDERLKGDEERETRKPALKWCLPEA